MRRGNTRIAIAGLLAAGALALAPAGAEAANVTFCVTAGPSGTPYPGCSGTPETSLSAAFTAADAAEPGTETLYLGPGTYTTSGANGFVDNSGNNPISIIGDGEANTTLTTSTTGGRVLDVDDGTASNDQQASVSNLTVAMNNGGVGVFVPQHIANVAITDSGSGSGTGLWTQNTTVDNVTITMPETATTTGLYRPNGTLTANGLTITAHTGITGNGTRDSYTNVRIFANGSGFDGGNANGSLASASSITESEIVMTGNGTALKWDENGPYQATLDASFLTIVGDGTAGSVGVASFAGNNAGAQANVVLTNSIVQNFATSLGCTNPLGSAALTASYSDINPASQPGTCSGGITVGAGDITANPNLVAQANGDETLAFNSPAIDAGDPAIAGPLTDLAGNPRPVNTGAGSRVDMGAFQFQQSRTPTAVAAAGSSSVAAGTPATFTAAGSSDPDGAALSYSWSFDDGGSATGPSVQHAFSQAGTHSATLTVTNSLGMVATATAHVSVTTPVASASAASATVSGTSVSDVVTCTGDSGATCAVTLSLEVTETLKGSKVIAVAAKGKGKPKKTHRTVIVGTASVSLRAGQSQTVTVTLNPAGQRLLKKRHKLAAKFTVASGTSVLATRTVTFKKPKGKKKH